MDVREKLVELLAEYFNIGDSYAYNLTRVKSAFACGTVELDDFEEFNDETVEDIVSYLISNGVTVQECKVAEIDQFKLPIDDAILILKEEYKQRVDGYTTHLSYGGNGDPAEEVHIDALGMAIAALELQKQTFPTAERRMTKYG